MRLLRLARLFRLARIFQRMDVPLERLGLAEVTLYCFGATAGGPFFERKKMRPNI